MCCLWRSRKGWQVAHSFGKCLEQAGAESLHVLAPRFTGEAIPSGIPKGLRPSAYKGRDAPLLALLPWETRLLIKTTLKAVASRLLSERVREMLSLSFSGGEGRGEEAVSS